jgi:hypothetical protein
MNKNETLELINNNVYTLTKAWETMYHNKTYAIIHYNKVDEFFKTKRGAEGYIKRNANFSYYDDYTHDMVTPNANNEVIEILASELINIKTNKKVWYDYLKENLYNIFEYHLGENIIYTAKDANVTAELLQYIKDTIKEIEETQSMSVIEEYIQQENVSNVKSEEVEMVGVTANTTKLSDNEKIENVEVKLNETKTESKEIEVSQNKENDINVTVSFNQEKNGIELLFTDKPSDEIRSQIKAHKFRWSKFQKIWYAKDTDENRKFLQEIGFLNSENDRGNSMTSMVVEMEKEGISYPEININDIETYIIDAELSKRENDNAMFRNNERNHTKEIQDLFQSANDNVIELINLDCDKYIEYKVKTYLQSFKKKYYDLYVKILRHKADNVSWMVSGRGNLNVNRYNKKQEQLTNMMKQLSQLIDDFNSKIDSFKNKINRAKELEIKKSINNEMENINTNTLNLTKVTKRYKPGAVQNIFDNATKEIKVYSYNNQYFIFKNWSYWRIYNQSGNELTVLNKATKTLEEAKKQLLYILQQENENTEISAM